MPRWPSLTALAGAVAVLVTACTTRAPDASSPDRGSTLAPDPSDDPEPDRSTPGRRHLVDATSEWGVDTTLAGIRGHAVARADVNGDGWDDLFIGTFADRPVATYQVRGASGPAPDQLLLGSEAGFTLDSRFDGRLGRTAGAAFADLDADGDPDLVVSRNVRDAPRSDAPSEIYRNEGGSLVPASVLDNQRGGRAVGIVDFDGDGLDDIVLVEDRWSGSATGLFRNEGDLRFGEVTAELGFPAEVWGLGAGVGDLDGDGTDDLVIGGSNRWFLGDGEGFVEGSSSPLPWIRHGDEDDPAQVVLADADGDGRLDVWIGQHFNSTLDRDVAEPVRLYLNRGPGDTGHPVFEDVSDEVGLPPLTTKSPQLLLADTDGDGDDDLVTMASYRPGSTAGADEPMLPLVVTRDGGPGDGGSGALPRFSVPETEVGPHYWIDGVTLDANRDGFTDLFLVEWEPELSSRLLLNLPAGDQAPAGPAEP